MIQIIVNIEETTLGKVSVKAVRKLRRLIKRATHNEFNVSEELAAPITGYIDTLGNPSLPKYSETDFLKAQIIEVENLLELAGEHPIMKPSLEERLSILKQRLEEANK